MIVIFVFIMGMIYAHGMDRKQQKFIIVHITIKMYETTEKDYFREYLDYYLQDLRPKKDFKSKQTKLTGN